jgi:hypothetical protein
MLLMADRPLNALTSFGKTVSSYDVDYVWPRHAPGVFTGG